MGAAFHRDRDVDYRMAARTSGLDGDLSDRVQRAASTSSPFSVLAAAFVAQIGAQTGFDEVLFTIQSGGRDAGTRHAIGSFSNAVPVRVKVDRSETFEALASRVRGLMRSAIRHETLPYHRIQSLVGIKPDFALNLYPDAEIPDFAGLGLGERHFLPSPSDYGINLRWQRHHRDAAPVYEAEAYFDEGMIDPRRIEHFLDRQRRILNVATADPSLPVGAIVSRSRSDRPKRELPAHLPTPRLYDLVARSARETPERTAIRYRGEAVSYRALVERVEALAARLADTGIASGDRVAFVAVRSAGFVTILLALSRLGASFAAFDSAYPTPRLIEQANACRPDWIVAEEARFGPMLDELRAAGWRCADLSVEHARTGRTAPLPPEAASADIAYYLFTSGTTGQPRSIGVGHAALPAFIQWQRETFDIGSDDRVTMLSGLAHDPVMRDVLLPLACGAALLIPDEQTMQEPRALLHWLQAERPSVMHATPPLGRLLAAISADRPVLDGLRHIFWGGDMLPREVIQIFDNANPGLGQINFYGSTETPQAVAFHRCGSEDRCRPVAPIGHATGPVAIAVVNEASEPLEANEVGEVRVLTPYRVVTANESFPSTDPQIGQDYRTGDRGYHLPDGAVMLIGRADDQVKIRGYRVELADVTRHIRSLDDVADAIVLVVGMPDGEQQLVAHVVPRGTADSSSFAQSIRRNMARVMPGYMVPAHVTVHEALPLLANGKIDRTALRACPVTTQGTVESPVQAHRAFTQGEREVAAVFESVLGRLADTPERTFAEMGADSLSSVQAMLRLEALLQDLPDDWHDRTIADLAHGLAESDERPVGLLSRLFRPVRLDLMAVARAAAIILIVAFHYKLLSVGGGLTFALFMLAGMAFARFQLGGVIATGSTRAISRGLIKIAIISFPIGLVFGLRSIHNDLEGGWRTIAFAANLIDFASIPPEQRSAMWLWFIGCYVQIILAVIMLLRIPSIRRIIAADSRRALLLAFSAMAALRFALPALFNPGGLGNIPAMSLWTYLPTAHAATFLLGALMETTQRNTVWRWAVIGMAAAYALATAQFFPGNGPILTVFTIVLVGLVVAIPVPRIVAQISIVVSQASLYIYLLHEPLYSVLTRLGVGSALMLMLISVPSIIVASMVFDRVYDRMAAFIAARSRFRGNVAATTA
jgi:amino acid adenylation domain-containing protein